jgi:transcriptional regulator with XRE-family HTH domain
MNSQNAGMPPATKDPRLGVVVRRLRMERNLTQEALAQRSGLTTGSVNTTELSKTGAAWVTVVALADGLDLTVTQLVALVEAEDPSWRPKEAEGDG